MYVVDKYSDLPGRDPDQYYDREELLFCLDSITEIRTVILDTYKYLSKQFSEKIEEAKAKKYTHQWEDDSKLIELYPNSTGDFAIDKTINFMKSNKSGKQMIFKQVRMIEQQIPNASKGKG